MRAQFQVNDKSGIEVQFNTHKIFIHLTAIYKHLGTFFSSSHSMDQEISARIGMTKSVFVIVVPSLCNRHLPETTRMCLFRALIESRLFFGIRTLYHGN